MNEKWYAVYTKPRWEKKVAETLTIKNINNYCPINKVVRQWSDRKKTVQVPLFTSYVFVQITEKQLNTLNTIDGVITVVTWLGKPAVIKNDEIATIKRFLHEYNNVQIEKSDIKVNDSVKITKGSLKDKEGAIVAVRNNIVQVALPTLGYILYAEVDKSNIVRVADKPILN